MLVAHGIWNGRLYLWAEVDTPTKTKALKPGLPVHPKAAPGGYLKGLFPKGAAEVTELHLLLPTTGRGPLPSPWTARSPQASSPRLGAWTVPAITLDQRHALSWLMEPRTAGGFERFAIGDSLDFLRHASRLALVLLAHQRFLPGLRPGLFVSSPSMARWSLVNQDPYSASLLEQLAQVMPSMLRASINSGDPIPDEQEGFERIERIERTDPRVKTREIVEDLGNHWARRLLGETHFASQAQSQNQAQTCQPELQHYLEALVAQDSPSLSHQETKASRFLASHQTWFERTARVLNRSHRTLFKLVAPDERSTHWRISLELHPLNTSDPILQLDEIWNEQSPPALQEQVVDTLDRARWAFNPLGRMLSSARPAPTELSVTELCEFLDRGQTELRFLGFQVEVPTNLAWAGAFSLRVELKAPSDGASFGLSTLCEFNLSLALGDQILSEEELQELLKSHRPLVKLGERWTLLDPHQVSLLKQKLDTLMEGRRISLTQALRASAKDDEASGLRVAFEGRDWIGELLTGNRTFRLRQAPPGFAGELRPYQARGFSWLAFLDELGIGACLADDMGLGKTPQLLALLLEARRAAPESCAGPTLLVSPVSLVGNWERESARFAPGLKTLVHHGPGRSTEDLASAAPRHDLVFTTYGLVVRDLEHLQSVPWGRIVLDEAQAIKNPASAQAKAIKALTAPHRIALTGTPLENRLEELWSILDFLNPGLLGSRREFQRRYATPIEKQADERAMEDLRKLTGPFLLRRLKSDPSIQLEIPEKLEMKAYCKLTIEQGVMYQAVVDELLAKLAESSGIARKGIILAALQKLKQICNHPVLGGASGELSGRSGKLEALETHLEEALAEGDKSLIFTQYAEWGKHLQPYLAKRFDQEVLFLHGGTPKTSRDRMVERFQSPNGPSVFILSIKAGGTGLNLTAATQVLHYDRWWNPAVEAQATDRAHRIGQTRIVQVRTFITMETLEERIDALLLRKRALSEAALSTGEAWLTELDEAAIRDLVTLGSDALEED